MALHPSPTAKNGFLRSDSVVTKGIHADTGPYRATMDVYCKQCGFPCNLDRDIRGVNDFFAGETITQATGISNGSFENWTGGVPDHWTVNGSVTQVTSLGYFDGSDDGTSSLQMTQTGLTVDGALTLSGGGFFLLGSGGHLLLTESGISAVSVYQSVSTPSDYDDDFLVFRARVKSLTNDCVRLRVLVNDTNYYSSYNVAQQAFQEMAVQVQCPSSVSTLSVYVLADNATGTAYVDQVTLARRGSSTTVEASSGCPHCSSFNYF